MLLNNQLGMQCSRFEAGVWSSWRSSVQTMAVSIRGGSGNERLYARFQTLEAAATNVSQALRITKVVKIIS